VILQLTGLDQTFEEMVRLYAGARAMSVEAASHREVYAQKADDEYRPRLNRWLRDQLTEHLQVIHQGVSEPMSAVLRSTASEAVARTRSTASRTVEDLLQLVAAHLLAPEFEDRYPDYPAFPALRQPISETARPTNAMEAIRFLAGRGRTNLATAVLKGLNLVDDQGAVRPYGSPYACHFLDQLQRKPEGQVVNRGEVIVQVAGGIQPIEKDPTFHLEPEWLAVILVALAYNGDVVLDLGGRQTLDASTVERAATMAIADLTGFRFYSRPRALPVNTWGRYSRVGPVAGADPRREHPRAGRAGATACRQRRAGAHGHPPGPGAARSATVERATVHRPLYHRVAVGRGGRDRLAGPCERRAGICVRHPLQPGLAAPSARLQELSGGADPL